jgi:hypothetical protein
MRSLGAWQMAGNKTAPPGRGCLLEQHWNAEYSGDFLALANRDAYDFDGGGI